MNNSYYDPPYDSPIEDIFAWNIYKYINPEIDFRKQELIETSHGKFYIDFVFEVTQNEIIGVECDGKEFHDRFRDEWRDAIILDNSKITQMFRISGADIQFHIEDVLYIFSRWEPRLFSERGIINLTHLASDTVVANSMNDSLSEYVHYLIENAYYIMEVRRESKINLGGVKRQFWQTLARFAKINPYLSLDQLILKHNLETSSKNN